MINLPTLFITLSLSQLPFIDKMWEKENRNPNFYSLDKKPSNIPYYTVELFKIVGDIFIIIGAIPVVVIAAALMATLFIMALMAKILIVLMECGFTALHKLIPKFFRDKLKRK